MVCYCCISIGEAVPHCHDLSSYRGEFRGGGGGGGVSRVKGAFRGISDRDAGSHVSHVIMVA